MAITAASLREVLGAFALALVLVVAEADVVLGGHTFQTSQVCHGTVPGGAYGYPGPPHTGMPSADPGASAWVFQPQAKLAHRLYANGELPLWNPHEALGLPFAAEMQSAPFSPLRLPVIVFPTPGVADATDFARLLLAGLGALVLARRLGVGRTGAVLSGTTFMLTGFFTAYTTTEIDVDVLLPWVLLAFDGLLERKAARQLALAAGSVALAIVAGFPESTFFVLAMAGIFFAFRASSEPFRAVSRRAWAWDLGRFWAAVALGHLVAAFALAPFVELLGLATVPDHTTAAGLAHYPARTAITLLVPNFFGPYYQEWNAYGSCLDMAHYLGVVPVFLGALAPGRSARGRLAWFLAAFAGVGLLKIYGAPGLNEAIGTLPVLRVSLFARYFQPEVALATALLAGLGHQRIAAGELSRGRVAWTGVGVLGALGFLTSLQYEPLAAGRWRTSGPLVAIELAFLAAATVLAWSAVPCSARVPADTRWPRVRGRRAACALLLLLVAVELGRPVPRDRLLRHDPFTPPPYVLALERDTSAFRVFTCGKLLHPNTASVFALDDVRALEAIYPERYLSFCKRFLSGVYNEPPPELVASRLYAARRALSLLNVKYLVAPGDLLSPDRIDEIGATSRTHGRGGPATFRIGGVERTVLAQAPPAETTFELDVPARDAVLHVTPVLHPATWAAGHAVDFEIDVGTAQKLERVFTCHLEPTSSEQPARTRSEQPWTEASIDLSRWAGQRALFLLATRSPAPAPDTLAGWGEVRLASPWDGLECVHRSKEARIFANPDVLPRAFVVHASRVLDGEGAVLDALADPAFDPRSTVLLEGGPPLEAPSGVAPLSSATIVERSANRVVVDCSLGAAGYLVLLDASYPGWKVRVEGRERPLLRADDLFRAVALDAGAHRVELVYEPASFFLGAVASAVGLLVLAGCFAASSAPYGNRSLVDRAQNAR